MIDPAIATYQLLAMAKARAAGDTLHGYTAVADFEPHEWVRLAMRDAYNAGVAAGRAAAGCNADQASLLHALRTFHNQTEACSEFDLPTQAIAELLVANLIEGTHYMLTTNGEAMLAAAPDQEGAEDA